MTPIDIDCVDGTGRDEVVAEFRTMYPRALRVHSVGHMVRSILGRLGSGGAIRRLRVFGHGAPGVQGLGRSQGGNKATLTYHSISIFAGVLRYRDILSQLTARFHHWNENGANRLGWVELHGCNVGAAGQGDGLVRLLAGLWRVNVAAGTGYQISQPGFEGYYVVAHPDGTVHTKLGTAVRTMST